MNNSTATLYDRPHVGPYLKLPSSFFYKVRLPDDNEARRTLVLQDIIALGLSYTAASP